MKSFSIASAAATALAGAALFISGVAADVDPIVIKGSHFFYKTNGTEFFIKGVAYQQEATTADSIKDPLADEAGCARDVPLLTQLGTNVIRVYAIDPTADHSKCMALLQAAGIYVLQDLSSPKKSINRDSPEWTTDLFASYASVIDAMAPYTNTLGFFAGNEVSNQVNNTAASAFVKAAVRDTKAYIKTKNYRTIGVGYATNDDAAIRADLSDYFNCGPADSAIDFWGYNIYSWCGSSSFTKSGYDQRTAEFANYSVPAFFAEYGCNVAKEGRLFTEVQAIYGPQMTNVWSGGIVYMYFEEANNYGLVSLSGSTASKLPDFSVLSSQIAKATPSATAASAYAVTNTAARACPTVGADWSAHSNLPPIANAQLCSCMMSSLSCTAKSSIDNTTFGDHFSYVCGQDPASCTGILANATTGVYGAYSMCTPLQKLSFAFNQYYLRQKKASTACDFGGLAQTQTGSSPDGCAALVSAAGTAGTATVTAVPTAASAVGGSGSASSTTSKAAASSVVIPRFEAGLVSLGAYVTFALVAGAGMMLL